MNDERGYPRTQGMKDVMHLVSPAERAAIAGLPRQGRAGEGEAARSADRRDARRAEGKLVYTTKGAVRPAIPDGSNRSRDIRSSAA